MSQTILATFDSPEEAREFADALRREGFPRESITLMSAEPIHIEAGDVAEEPPSRIGVFTVGGALLGATGALLLTIITSQRVNLVTGGMPIVTPWAFGIITFELTALGAILAALFRMIFEARLARPGALADYDQAVADGKIVVAVACDSDERRAAASRMSDPTNNAQDASK